MVFKTIERDRSKASETGSLPESKFKNQQELGNGSYTPDDSSRAAEKRKKEKYRIKLYSEEDRSLYKDVLSKTPYDVKLDKQFIRFRRKETKSRKKWDRLVAPGVTLEMEYALPKASSTEDEVIKNECHALLIQFISEETSETVAARLYKYYGDGMTLEAIAAEEGTSLQSVSESIHNAIKRIRRRFKEAGYNVPNV
ncbi:MAG: sigma-70 family RNA polymerase sigma factor [Clostridia bacterium]|nr:sigma-70 family RNA polymerase sigma factor [Clostridia bacterium]